MHASQSSANHGRATTAIYIDGMLFYHRTTYRSFFISQMQQKEEKKRVSKRRSRNKLAFPFRACSRLSPIQVNWILNQIPFNRYPTYNPYGWVCWRGLKEITRDFNLLYKFKAPPQSPLILLESFATEQDLKKRMWTFNYKTDRPYSAHLICLTYQADPQSIVNMGIMHACRIDAVQPTLMYIRNKNAYPPVPAASL